MGAVGDGSPLHVDGQKPSDIGAVGVRLGRAVPAGAAAGAPACRCPIPVQHLRDRSVGRTEKEIIERCVDGTRVRTESVLRHDLPVQKCGDDLGIVRHLGPVRGIDIDVA